MTGTEYRAFGVGLPYHEDGRERDALVRGLLHVVESVPKHLLNAQLPPLDLLYQSPIVAVEWAQMARAQQLVEGLRYMADQAEHSGPECWGQWYNAAAFLIEMWIEGTPLSQRWTSWERCVLDRWAVLATIGNDG